MSDLNNINTPTLTPGAGPSTNTCTAGPDRWPAAVGARYMLIWNNTAGAPVTITTDDPVSTGPVGAFQFNPDVQVLVSSGSRRVQFIDANRFRDVNGWVNVSYSVSPTMTLEIHGPL